MHDNITAIFQQIKEKWPDSRIEVAIWNAAQWSRIPFLEVKEKVSSLTSFREPPPPVFTYGGSGHSKQCSNQHVGGMCTHQVLQADSP